MTLNFQFINSFRLEIDRAQAFLSQLSARSIFPPLSKAAIQCYENVCIVISRSRLSPAI